MRALLLIIAVTIAGVVSAFAFVERPAGPTVLRVVRRGALPHPAAPLDAPEARALSGPETRAASTAEARAPSVPAVRTPSAPQRTPPPAPQGPPLPASDGAGGAIFLNTYYDFPEEPAEPPDTTLYDARCAPVAIVARSFHDRLCVQGSGRTASGITVSFAARGCACAEVCPRTGQRICYDALDRARFPHGRGATGRPITPLRTVAVDPTVIPLGTPLYIPELAGLARPDGTLHDGCFVAGDAGVKIKGLRIDVFAGDSGTRQLWEVAVPSNRGVHVLAGGAGCPARDRTAVARRRGG